MGGKRARSSPSFREWSAGLCSPFKLDHVLGARPDILTSADMGCLMHLNGLATRHDFTVKPRHVSQILSDALREDALLEPVEGVEP